MTGKYSTRVKEFAAAVACAWIALLQPTASHAITINFFLADNPIDDAFIEVNYGTALNAARTSYETLLEDAIAINIELVLENSLPSNVLAAARPRSNLYTIDRLAPVFNAGHEDPLSSLFYVDGAIRDYTFAAVSRANQKSLGLVDPFSGIDGTITLSTNIARFDLDPFDGLASGFDAASVIRHEIGHILGFTSAVDYRDLGIDGTPTLLDFMRYSDESLAAGLTQLGLDFLPDLSADSRTKYVLTDPIDGQIGKGCYLSSSNCIRAPLSEGVIHGDGNQASHWSESRYSFPGGEDKLGNPRPPIEAPIGLMDPFGGGFETFSYFDIEVLTRLGFTPRTILTGPGSDGSGSGGGTLCVTGDESFCFRHHDVQLEDEGTSPVPVPEPTSLGLLSIGLLSFAAAARRTRT